MKAYVIAAETIKDPVMFDDYRKVVPETLAPFGGRFVARGGNLTVLEGEWPHSRLVVIEFPSRPDAGAVEQVAGVSEGHLPPAQEFRRHSHHRLWSALSLSAPAYHAAIACDDFPSSRPRAVGPSGETLPPR